ncbi:MAG: glycine zipper 2TM domain-containing protein [Proteobacteria bacterium]|nr:MAG: glycine zipper 2TM domain-containing protein [Pseudomonadota bacterium]
MNNREQNETKTQRRNQSTNNYRGNSQQVARGRRSSNESKEYVQRAPRAERQHEFVDDMTPVGEMQWSLRHRKKIVIGLIAVGSLALAIGIGELIANSGKVRIINVAPATVTAQQPYQDCRQVSTTNYSRNHKNGTEGAVIGGVGGAAVGGLVSHSWVGAGVGAAVGAVGGDLIERSHQPDYVAHRGSATQCQTAYRQIQVPIGYQVGYMNSDDNMVQIITQHQPVVGSRVKPEELEADQVTPQQQQQLVQQAISGNNTGGNAPQGANATQQSPQNVAPQQQSQPPAN